MKVKDLLNDPTKWCKGAYARDKYGMSIPPWHESALKWCLNGAIVKCYGKDSHKNVLSKLGNVGIMQLSQWNDSPSTRFADVRKLVEHFDI